MLDNNKVKQELKLQFTKIASADKSNVMSSKTFHNTKMAHDFQIINYRTKAKDKRPSLSNNHSDNNIMDQEIEQQESKYSISKVDHTSTEHELEKINSCNRSTDKRISTLTNVDNGNKTHMINLRSKNIELQCTTYSTCRNKVDNNTMPNKSQILISRHDAKHKKTYPSCSNTENLNGSESTTYSSQGKI